MASLDFSTHQLNSDPVWTGSAAVFSSNVILAPGMNQVFFAISCSGILEKEQIFSHIILFYFFN